MQLLCFVSDNMALKSLSEKAATRTHAAFRPKTRQAYFRMFRIFLAFCICMDVSVVRVDVKVILSILECHKGLFYLDHPNIRYFQKSIKINRPLTLTSHNIIDLASLEKISAACTDFTCVEVLQVVFLIGFFRLSWPLTLKL